MIRVGDYVTRKSYNHDIVFKVINITSDIVLLSGINVRLSADSPLDDLVLYNSSIEDNFDDNTFFYKSLDRNDYFYLPGCILHFDGDKDFLDRCMKFYKKNKIKAYGFFCDEGDLASKMFEYLDKYKPDILVITGHDAMYRKERRKGKYKNTDNFIKAIKEARRYEKSHDKLLIVAGGCQSNYEELIKAGANFASSPKRINIHALDPAVIAVALSFSDRNENIDIIKILDKTNCGALGMGGIITKGTMYVGYPREKGE